MLNGKESQYAAIVGEDGDLKDVRSNDEDGIRNDDCHATAEQF
jgi:hypothetical protein